MRIAIYDTRHFEMINVLFRVLSQDNNELIFFISPIIYQKLTSVYGDKLNNFTFIIEGKKEPIGEFFERIETESNLFKPQLFIFNTIDKDYKKAWLFLKNSSFKYLVTIHNINTWLSPPFTLNRIALSNYYFRRKIVKKSSGLIVQEELFVEYIKKKNLYSKPVLTIPHTLKEEESIKPKNDKIIITIPGAIDGVRRDIDLTLDVIEEVLAESNSFRFVFIGKVIGYLGEPILKRIESLQEKGLDIDHVYNENSNLDFDRLMKNCDLVLVPLNVNTKFEGIPEIYGTTKVTGVIYDMMRFSKPGIVPEKMVVPPTMKNSLITYANKDHLVQIILSLDNPNNNISDWQDLTNVESEYYTEKSISDRVLPKIYTIFK